jgi:16S rRNA (cytosine1402-N4)-methyltransferase
VGERFYHRPVLLREVLDALKVHPGGVYIDATIGEGGHALAILEASMPGGRLLGIDADPLAIEAAGRRLGPFSGSFTLVKGNYARLEEVAPPLGFAPADGILFDLGISALQLEGEERGFSFQREEPLDMRYDPQQGLTAADVVNTYPLEELAQLIARYGEEPRARSIARAIVQRRPIRSALELAEVIQRVVGGRRRRLHPATRTFQAIRIAVNRELENLEAGLTQAIRLLKPGGRLVVISYHSLEDRLVKGRMRLESRGCICPPRTPLCICGHTPSLRVLSRKAVKPSAQEVRSNPRCRSARMRVAERI